MPQEPEPPAGVCIDECGPKDRARQARLFNACFKKHVEPEDLVWRYEAGPHGESLSFVSALQEAEGELDEGAVVSGYACSPRVVIPYGDETHACAVGETGDVMTHPDFRGRGFFSQLDRRCMEATKEAGWPLCFGLPNNRSAHIFLELGWKDVGTVRPWTHILKWDRGARAIRRREGRLRWLLSGWGAWTGARARTGLGLPDAHEVRRVERFDDEVIELTRAQEARFSLILRRDAEYLNWRFIDNPSGLHRAFGIFQGDKLRAYVVIQVPRAGQSVGYLVDAIACDDARLEAAIGAGLSALEECDASAVQATAIDGSFWSRMLQGAGFLSPRPDNSFSVILYRHDPEHPLCQAAVDTSSWYFTDGDRDDETMG